MTAQLIDGTAISRALRAEVAARVATLASRKIRPGLAVVLVGEDPASQIYVRHKIKACEDAGINSRVELRDASFSQAELLELIATLNADPAIHGILVQLPLPRQIDSRAVIEAIAPSKDVDGFHMESAGALFTGNPGFRPCTPYGIMKMLEHIGTPLRGARAVVVGRSNNVGKPVALLLLEKNATVTICHSATTDLAACTREADIVVLAVGRRNVLTASMVKPGAVVIDVGMNREADGKLYGDADFAGVREVAGWITPVPGGVGPMTVTMLLVNTLESAERTAKAS